MEKQLSLEKVSEIYKIQATYSQKKTLFGLAAAMEISQDSLYNCSNFPLRIMYWFWLG